MDHRGDVLQEMRIRTNMEETWEGTMSQGNIENITKDAANPAVTKAATAIIAEALTGMENKSSTRVSDIAFQLPTDTQSSVPVSRAAVTTKMPQQNTRVGEVYFTDGELLPWKGRWFRAHLNEETKRIELELMKPTASALKRESRVQRWAKQHPHATRSLHGSQAYYSARV